MSGRNLGASVRAKLLNTARAEKRDFGLVLTRYALERLLYRLSISTHADHFLLKGALLFDLWFDVPHRPTRDIDLLGFGLAEFPYLVATFEDLCQLDVEDGILFEASSIRAEEIRNEANYQGIRITLLGYVDGARCPVQVDVGYGDAVTPDPETVDYPVIFTEFPAPRLKVYPRYSVVAEKLEAMISLGMANTRMKDYFDLWVLCKNSDFEGTVLQQAVSATLNRRSTAIPEGVPLALSEGFHTDRQKQAQWAGFLKKNQLEATNLGAIVDELRRFLLPVVEAIREGREFSGLWSGQHGWASS